jgi:hypothetical protein
MISNQKHSCLTLEHPLYYLYSYASFIIHRLIFEKWFKKKYFKKFEDYLTFIRTKE